ncbi:hypothetical protein WN943_004700 [Citrus x changshan-huyou]
MRFSYTFLFINQFSFTTRLIHKNCVIQKILIKIYNNLNRYKCSFPTIFLCRASSIRYCSSRTSTIFSTICICQFWLYEEICS